MPYYKYYHYDPSLAASIIFAIVFGVIASWHIFLLVRTAHGISYRWLWAGYVRFPLITLHPGSLLI